MELETIKSKLRGAGADIQDWDRDFINYEYDGHNYSIAYKEVSDNYTVQDIINESEMYSCCGDVMTNYPDNDICPTCKEHC